MTIFIPDLNLHRHTVTLREFAKRLDRNEEWVRRAFGELAVKKNNKLYFDEADVADTVEQLVSADLAEFTVSLTEIAKRLGVDPRTAKTHMTAIEAPHRYVGRYLMFRESDVAKVLKRAYELEYIGEDEVAALCGATPFQIHMLSSRPWFFNHGFSMPSWRRETIEPWAREFAMDPSRFLNELGLRHFRDAATPEKLIITLKREYDVWLENRKSENR